VTEAELRVLEARWRLGEIGPTDLHELADSLLGAGENAEALIRLFSLERDQLRWEGAAVFEDLLREWGGGSMDDREAVEVFVHDLSSGLVEGRIDPLGATSRAEAMYVGSGYRHDALTEWYELHEELGYLHLEPGGVSYLGRDRATIEADVMSLARSTLRRHS
jgi:hypothetical protein